MTNRKQSRARSVYGPALVLAALVGLVAFTGSASADERDHDRGRGREYHHNWNGGYYYPPPVIYGAPGYYPPPVIYGPGVGVTLPGVNLNFR
jgi:hypothetical protein